MPEPATTTRTESRLEAARRFRAGVVERAADRVARLEWGTAYYNAAVPRLIELNAVHVEVPVSGLTAEALAATVDRLQEGLPQRRVEVYDERTAAEVTPGLLAAGWDLHRSLLMAAGPAPAAPAGIAVDEVPYDQVVALRAEWIRSHPWAAEDPVVAQVLAGDELMFTATPTRAFTAGRRSYALLLELGGEAMIEDVYTTPAERGQGLAAAVVSRIVAEAQAGGSALTFLSTDAAGQARHLYARLGFEPLGIVHRYLREP